MGKEINREKLRDMIRSILPSKNREAARVSKALTNRAHRRGVRIDVRHEDAEETSADFERRASHRETVGNRRNGDKLNHFMRWCEAMTEGMSKQEALDFVRSILPDSLIGDHAYGHWESHRRYFSGRRNYPSSLEIARRRLQSYVDSASFRLRRALAVDPSLHTRLNAEIKRRKLAGEPRRLLAGTHDVEDFARTIARRDRHGEWPDPFAAERKATLELIEQVEQMKGGRKAALLVAAVKLRAHPCDTKPAFSLGREAWARSIRLMTRSCAGPSR